MEFEVGAKVVHPAHGPGLVVEIEHNELVEGFNHYYVIEFTQKRMTVRVPFRHAEEAGLRQVMTNKKRQQVMETLSKLPKQLPSDFKKRRQEIETLIYSGYPMKVAEAVRELSWRRRNKQLSVSDRRLLEEARGMLISEIALSSDESRKAVQSEIDDELTRSAEAQMAIPVPAAE